MNSLADLTANVEGYSCFHAKRISGDCLQEQRLSLQSSTLLTTQQEE